MKSRQRTCAAFFFVLFCGIVPRLGSAQDQPQSTNLTLEQALSRARLRAPILLSARARIEEARARLRGSSILQQTNPMVEGTVGPRFSDPSNVTAADVSVSQDFEAFGRRSARIAGAQAGVSREIAASHETARQLLRDVATSFARALAASERLKVLAAGDQLASAFLDTAERRFQAGDIPVLEVNLAKNSAARTRAALLS